MRCDEAGLQLAGAADSATDRAPDLDLHVSSCLRCQAELAQYRKLLRALASLRTDVVEADEQYLFDLLDLLRPPATVHRLHRRNRRAAYIGGIAAAATAGAAGAIVIASRMASRQSLAS